MKDEIFLKALKGITNEVISMTDEEFQTMLEQHEDGEYTKILRGLNYNMPIINDDCISCGMCLEECPVGAIEISNIKTIEKGYSQSEINQDLCIDCKTCINNFECPANAIVER